MGSFIFGAVGGALIAMKLGDPVRGLMVTAVCGGLAGFTCLIAWLHYLRRSPEIREVLAVTEDGTPDTTEFATVTDVPTPEPSQPSLMVCAAECSALFDSVCLALSLAVAAEQKAASSPPAGSPRPPIPMYWYSPTPME